MDAVGITAMNHRDTSKMYWLSSMFSAISDNIAMWCTYRAFNSSSENDLGVDRQGCLKHCQIPMSPIKFLKCAMPESPYISADDNSK